MKLTLGGLVVIAAAAACSASAKPNTTDGGDMSEAGASDASGPPADALSNFAAQASIVLVDGLVAGNTTDTSGKGLDLDDVRVCIRNAATKAPITTYAVPDSSPMPLTNYPGVRRGSGIDLGSINTFDIDIDVFSAQDLSSDAAWVSKRDAFTCQQIECDQGSLPCRAHARLHTTVSPGVNVVALVDKAGGIDVAVRSFGDNTFNGTPGSLWGTVVDFSGWHSSLQVGAYYGNPVDGSGAINTKIADPLASQPLQPQEIAHVIDGYEALGIRFDAWSGGQPSDRFGQSLDSIAFVANAVVTPPQFFDVRQNFVFALVGDPNDPTSVAQNGGRDPTFDGRGLHIAAIPYATPLPEPQK